MKLLDKFWQRWNRKKQSPEQGIAAKTAVASTAAVLDRFLNKKRAQPKPVKAKRYPDGFSHAGENARREQQFKKGRLRFHVYRGFEPEELALRRHGEWRDV